MKCVLNCDFNGIIKDRNLKLDMADTFKIQICAQNSFFKNSKFKKIWEKKYTYFCDTELTRCFKICMSAILM